MGTGAHSAVTAPTLALVELGDEFQQVVGGGVDLAGQQRDFVGEVVGVEVGVLSWKLQGSGSF